jgi:hypothetical protein
MALFSRRSWFLISTAFAIKTLVTIMMPAYISSDFVDWVHLTQLMSSQVQAGMIPQLSGYGAYAFMGLFLVPFFLAWSALPIAHPACAACLLSQSFSVGELSLNFMMKLPIMLCDLFTGIMISIISRKFKSGVAARAFWIWYLNPFTTFLMELNGTIDIIPTFVFLCACYLGLKRRWFWSGFLLFISCIMRFFPIFAFPFLALYALREKSKRGISMFLTSFGLSILAVISVEAAIVGSFGGLVGVISFVLANQPWLLAFLGFSVSSFVNLTPFLVIIQIYFVARYWKANASVVDSALVGVLVLLLASYHQPYDVTWILPLITIYYIVNSDWTLLYTLLFITSFLYYLVFNATDVTLIYLQPLFAGLFYGVKGVYLLRVNFKAFGWKRETVRKYLVGH